MASSTTRRQRWIKGSLWVLGGFLMYRLLFWRSGGDIPTRISESTSSLGLEASDSPVALESSGQWLVTLVHTVAGWIGSMITIALVFALIAIAVMVLTDWSAKRA